MDRDKTYSEDIINFLVKNDVVYLILFNVYLGVLENKQIFKFEYTSSDFLEEFLIQYYSDNRVPKELILPVMLSDSMMEFLRIKAGRLARVFVPKRGDKKQLLDLVLKNIEITFFGDKEKLDDLKKMLKMQDYPDVIECFDISHISGTSTVASMVQFKNALPYKNNYRRYRIKTVQGIDDYSAVSEVVRRRYIRLLRENRDLPDLILIDGGLGQLNAAITELKKLNINVPIISIAKKFEEIYVPGTGIPLVLKKKSKALKFLQQIRDEAHRFAIKYNRLLRIKEMLS